MTTQELLAEAAGTVAKALYENKDNMPEGANAAWLNRPSREDRIAHYRALRGIPNEIGDDLIALAIVEDWDLE